jgi:transcriptional regulator with XRE-family HTH domain
MSVTVGDWLGRWVADAPARPAGVPPRETLGQRLRRLRTQRGQHLAQVARDAGVGYQALYWLERGRVQRPDVYTALALARYYGITVERLMEGLA